MRVLSECPILNPNYHADRYQRINKTDDQNSKKRNRENTFVFSIQFQSRHDDEAQLV